jgi:hypothetical protein
VGGCSGVHLIAKKGAADFTVNFSFFKWITVGDTKGWGQFSRTQENLRNWVFCTHLGELSRCALCALQSWRNGRGVVRCGEVSVCQHTYCITRESPHPHPCLAQPAPPARTPHTLLSLGRSLRGARTPPQVFPPAWHLSTPDHPRCRHIARRVPSTLPLSLPHSLTHP